jgi:uncharacterized membrane protein
VGASAAIAGAAINWFKVGRQLDGHDMSWLTPSINSPRNLLLRTFIGYTHPLLPWLAFFCAGIILGRSLQRMTSLRPKLLAAGAAMFLGSYLVNYVGLRWATDDLARTDRSARLWRAVLSTGPWDRGVLYTVNALGSSIVAFCVISWLADRFPDAPMSRALAHAGQMTLTLYVVHVLVFNGVVHWWEWVRPTGLDTALAFSVVFWSLAITAGALWHRRFGTGPLERIYRGFGG